MSNIFIVSMIISFQVSVILYIIYISIANKRRVYQTTREEGPKSHRVKNGTITMGGIIFVLVTTTIFSVFSLRENSLNINQMILLLIVFIGMAVIGFIDDYLKVVRLKNDGISPKTKLMLQFIVSFLSFIFFMRLNISTTVDLFFIYVDLRFLYAFLIFFYIVGFSNASNLTDGLDGLCAGVSIIILVVLLLFSIHLNEYTIALFLLCLIASLLAFLLFNFKKALIFMGDTGSLAIGGVIAVVSLMLKLELLILLIALAMVFETLSVIIQVSYFKMTKGKRIFKMAPIHHHFELLGMSEKMIVIMFYLFTTITGLVSLYLGGIL